MGEILRYSLEIKWSDEDQCYVVLAPEWENYFGPIAEGATMRRRRRGGYALENMIAFAHERGEPLPQPQTFVGA